MLAYSMMRFQILRNEGKAGLSSQGASPVVEFVGNRRVCHVKLADFVLETLDNSRVAGGVEGSRRVPGDAAQVVQQLPLVAESWVHPSLFQFMSIICLFLKEPVSLTFVVR